MKSRLGFIDKMGVSVSVGLWKKWMREMQGWPRAPRAEAEAMICTGAAAEATVKI